MGTVNPPSQTSGTSRSAPLTWSSEMEEALLDGLCKQVRQGKRADSGFKKEAWMAVLPSIQALVTQKDDKGNLCQLTQTQASNKTLEFKTLYIEWQLLCEATGFGWDEDAGIPTAPDNVWSHYLKVC